MPSGMLVATEASDYVEDRVKEGDALAGVDLLEDIWGFPAPGNLLSQLWRAAHAFLRLHPPQLC